MYRFVCASVRACLLCIALVHRKLSAQTSIPAHECDVATGHYCGLFYAMYIYIHIYMPEAISLALYPHDANKFVLALPYFMWL